MQLPERLIGEADQQPSTIAVGGAMHLRVVLFQADFEERGRIPSGRGA
jgi:hypothetical protein